MATTRGTCCRAAVAGMLLSAGVISAWAVVAGEMNSRTSIGENDPDAIGASRAR